MKKMFSLLIIAVLLFTARAYATDIQVWDNGTNKGVATKINFKGGTVTRSGLTATVDYSNLSNVNWQALPQVTQSYNINWASVNALNPVNSGGVNWTDLKTAETSLAGINWNFASNQGNGINWIIAANGATAATITCWKSNGQLGKCGTGVSGTGCTACL